VVVFQFHNICHHIIWLELHATESEVPKKVSQRKSKKTDTCLIEAYRLSVENQTSFLCFVAGGLICFDIYEQHLDEWKNKLLEFEKKGIWENVAKEKLPLYGADDFPGETNAFVFKVQWNVLKAV